jgi:hypothetical protein
LAFGNAAGDLNAFAAFEFLCERVMKYGVGALGFFRAEIRGP